LPWFIAHGIEIYGTWRANSCDCCPHPGMPIGASTCSSIRVFSLNKGSNFYYLIFLLKCLQIFFSPKSSAAGATQLVILFMANNKHWMHDQMLCMQRDPTFGTLRRMSVRKDLVSSLGICALDLYVLTCTENGWHYFGIFELNCGIFERWCWLDGDSKWI
jgi:hypothetical protein